MQVELLNDQGQASAKYDAPETVFGREYNEDLVHQIVVAYQANARQGTRAQKDREQVKHSTKKPFKQKGTGRARAGMTSSPIWRGGGRIFPNMPDENFTQKINKKMYRAGMASIFSQLAREGRLAVVESLKVESPKTKLLAAKFKAMNLQSVLVIFLLIFCVKFSSGMFGKIRPPPRQIGEDVIPARARPVPFCLNGFLVECLTCSRSFCARVPWRALAW